MGSNLKFCDYFNYPHEIKEHFNKIIDLLKSYNVISVILLGSGARGELIYEIKKNGIKIYSDYDILIVVNNYKYAKKLKDSLLKLNYEMKKSIMFNLDFKLITMNQLFSLPKDTYTYSLKNRSLVIWGKDIRNSIPDVRLYNIDMKKENEDIIKVLWYVLYYMPSSLFYNNSKTESLMKGFKFIICKYALQIVPWFLLLEGNLINSIDVSKGVEFIKREYHKLYFFNFIGKEFLTQLELFNEGYFHLEFNIGTRELYDKFVNYIFNALKYLIYRETSLEADSENIVEYLMNNASLLFNDCMLKARMLSFISLFRNLISLRNYDIRLMYPFIFRKNAFITSLLLSLHFSLRDYFMGNENFYHSLKFIEKYFGKIKSYSNEEVLNFLLRSKQSLVDFILTFSYYPWLPFIRK